MFKKHSGRKSANPILIFFRLILSLVMFIVLLGGVYTAYKQFSGLDPLKLDPGSVLATVVGTKDVNSLISKVPILKQKLEFGNWKLDNQSSNSKPQHPSSKYLFRFLLVADSHSDNENLKKAISQAKQSYADLAFIIGLGDYTEVGTLEELTNVKKELDSYSLRYFVIPGDHDLWDARDKQKEPLENFRQVFGPSYQSFTFDNFYFLLLNNSDNYSGISKEQQDWITTELEKAKTEGSKGVLVFLHEPLYHPSSDHFMGRVEKDLKLQSQSLIYQLKSAGVKKVFFGDTHYFSEYEEPATKLEMVTVGAVVKERNPQVPRYAVVSVLEDGSVKVQDIEIK